MKLFSKRHIERRLSHDRIRYRRDVTVNELVTAEVRNRLITEIKFLSSNNDFLEWHVLFEDKRDKPSHIYYDEDKINDFTMSELGYRMSNTFNFINFEMIKTKQSIRYASDDKELELFYDDFCLFDLAEITILFAKSNQRKNVIERLNNIFHEESTDYEIVEHLITRKSGDDLKAIMGILKDQELKSKLERFFDYFSRKDFLNAAKVSADIINIIYSDERRGGKKKQIELMKQKLARNLIIGKSKDKIERVESYIDNLLRNANSINNDVYDIRHTELSTVRPHGDNVYKMAATQNLMIIEITITSLKDDFVLNDDWENIKATYVEKYKVNIKSRRVYEMPMLDDDLKPTDIPF